MSHIEFLLRAFRPSLIPKSDMRLGPAAFSGGKRKSSFDGDMQFLAQIL